MKYEEFIYDAGRKSMKIVEARALLDSFPLLYFNGYQKSKEQKVKDFLKEYFNLNNKYDTLQSDTNKQITLAGKNIRRSLVDVYLTTKYYFPKARLKTIIKFLIKGPIPILYQFCNATQRGVYRTNDVHRIYGNNVINEFGWSVDRLKEIADKE